MPNLSNPNTVHEILAIALVTAMFPVAFLAMAYINTLSAFFNELKEKEPNVWASVGSPRLLDMLVLPFLRFKKYYAFLPVLQERAVRDDGDYKYARRAYMLLKAGLAMTALLFSLAGMLVFWILYHGL